MTLFFGHFLLQSKMAGDGPASVHSSGDPVQLQPEAYKNTALQLPSVDHGRGRVLLTRKTPDKDKVRHLLSDEPLQTLLGTL